MSDQSPSTSPVLDHLALASYHAWDNVIRYCYQLGGRWLGGPTEPDADPFYFCQVEFEGGTKLEFLEPYPGEGSDFINRFLHRNGPGPHHLTFKVSDIDATMSSAERAGYDIVSKDLSDPDWKEAFLHPKQSHGIVIQLAQQRSPDGWETPPPLPPSPQKDPARIDKLQHLVADLDGAAELFSNVLGMEVVDEADGPMGPTVMLTSGPWTLALISPTSPGPLQWLGERPGRLLSLSVAVDDVSPISGLRRVHDFYELRPDVNQGTRVLLKEKA